MKKVVVFTIILYQKIFSAVFKSLLASPSFCRFSPTCSEYAKIKIEEEGVFWGSLHFFKRILKCQPFYKISKV